MNLSRPVAAGAPVFRYLNLRGLSNAGFLSICLRGVLIEGEHHGDNIEFAIARGR